MSIRKLRAGRVPTVTADEYVGEYGAIFWDESNGELRLSNGNTPGGKLLNAPVVATSNTPPPFPYEGELWYNPTTLELWAYHNGSFHGTINLATETEIGGIKLGPGVITNSEGQLIIDTSGLEFSFGDFYAIDNVISVINPNQDINLLSNGTGSINVIGELGIYKTDGDVAGALSVEPVFKVNGDGQIRMLIPLPDALEGAISIVGSAIGDSQTPVNTGVMLHITGNNNSPSRLYNDAVGGYAGFIGRRYNGSASIPQAVLNNQEIARLGVNAYTLDGWLNFGQARISFISTDNQDNANQGGKIEFWSTPKGTTTNNIVKVMTVDGGTGVTATQFNGPLTGNVVGNISGNAGTVTNGVYTSGSYADPTWLTISKSKVGLSNVENVALSTWTGSTNITTVGTLTNLSVSNTISGSINGNANTVSNGVYITDTGTVTNTMLAGNIANNKLQNSSITINGNTVSLGGSISTQSVTTWVPSIVFTNSGAVTYVTQSGYYVKSGQNVTCYFTIVISGSTATGTTNYVSIGNLPFTSITHTSNVGGGALDNFSFPTIPNHVTGVVSGSSTQCALYWHAASGNTNTIQRMSAVDLDSTATLVGRITYISAS